MGAGSLDVEAESGHALLVGFDLVDALNLAALVAVEEALVARGLFFLADAWRVGVSRGGNGGYGGYVQHGFGAAAAGLSAGGVSGEGQAPPAHAGSELPVAAAAAGAVKLSVCGHEGAKPKGLPEEEKGHIVVYVSVMLGVGLARVKLKWSEALGRNQI